MAILTESEKLKLKNMEICLLDEIKGSDKVRARESLIRLDTLYEIKKQLNLQKGEKQVRKLKRLVSKAHMRKAGIHKPFKKYKDGSFFSKHWREHL